MKIDYYLKKKHIFKQRTICKLNTRVKSINKYISFYSLKKFRFDFVYIRFIKKLLRRKFIKATTRFFKLKYWLHICPNYILTKKSKNSRMGAGVGSLVRLTHYSFPGKNLIRTYGYRLSFLKSLNNYLSFKLSKVFYIS